MCEKNNLFKTFLKYLIPSVSAMWFFSIYTMVDGIFVSRGVGPSALAAVSLSMPYINAIFAIALSVAVGSSTLISFYLGKNEKEKSNKIFTLNIIILSFIGFVISLFSFMFLEKISLFLGATEETLKYTMDYLGIIIIFSTFFMLAYSLEVLIKADGFPIYSIIFVSLAAFTNIILDYIFVIIFNYGVKGAALATGLSQLISFLGFLLHFLGRKSQLKFTKIQLDLKLAKNIFTIGLPEALTELSAGVTIFFFNTALLKYLGDRGVTAFGVIIYINNLVMMTMIAINQGIQPLISFYNGKKANKKIESIFKLALGTTITFSIFFIIISQLWTDELVSIFISSSNTDIYNLSQDALKIFSFSFALCGFNILISGYFTALKKIQDALFISIMRGFVLIPILLLILPNIIGATGIWLSPVVNEIITLVFSFNFFLKNKEKGDSTFSINKQKSMLSSRA